MMMSEPSRDGRLQRPVNFPNEEDDDDLERVNKTILWDDPYFVFSRNRLID